MLRVRMQLLKNIKLALYSIAIFIELSFDGLKDAKERHELKSVITTLSLPDETVDNIRAAATKILENSNEFKEFVNNPF
ncbi:MAG: hypothetical protein JW841_14225 [Deltaproteobacteria bacterium]|nr:hypothetical protein [Deltaproteobacteria bacterium]